MAKTLLVILYSLLTKLLTEKVVAQLIIMLLEYVETKTTNKVTTDLVVIVKDAFEDE